MVDPSNISTETESTSSRTINEIQELAIAELLKTMEVTNEVLKEVRDTIFQRGEPEDSASFAGIARAQVDAIREIATFAHNKEKIQGSKEIKKIEIEGKKEVQEHKHLLGDTGPKTQTNTINMISTQKDMFKLVQKMISGDEVTDEEKIVVDAVDATKESVQAPVPADIVEESQISIPNSLDPQLEFVEPSETENKPE